MSKIWSVSPFGSTRGRGWRRRNGGAPFRQVWTIRAPPCRCRILMALHFPSATKARRLLSRVNHGRDTEKPEMQMGGADVPCASGCGSRETCFSTRTQLCQLRLFNAHRFTAQNRTFGARSTKNDPEITWFLEINHNFVLHSSLTNTHPQACKNCGFEANIVEVFIRAEVCQQTRNRHFMGTDNEKGRI